jgi:hypothetical protein
VETVMAWWLITQDMDFYQEGIEKFIQHYDKCPSGDDFVEKY